VRALEDSANNMGLLEKEGRQETNLYITPSYRFKIVDALITNFHLPKSSLFILVFSIYRVGFFKEFFIKYAIENNYRFYSYGDGMFIK